MFIAKLIRWNSKPIEIKSVISEKLRSNHLEVLATHLHNDNKIYFRSSYTKHYNKKASYVKLGETFFELV